MQVRGARVRAGRLREPGCTESFDPHQYRSGATRQPATGRYGGRSCPRTGFTHYPGVDLVLRSVRTRHILLLPASSSPCQFGPAVHCYVRYRTFNDTVFINGNQAYVSTTDRSGEYNFTCYICGKPVHLANDTTTNEYGKIVHLECYLKQVGGPERTPPATHHTE